MLRVTRYYADGRVHHTCLTQKAQPYTDQNGRLYVDMPMRFWMVADGGKLEIAADEQVRRIEGR